MLNEFNRFRKTRVVVIRKFDEDLYRLVKAYASLEDRSIASIFEEAVSKWIESRGEYDEARLWVDLDRAYENNIRVLEENRGLNKEVGEGYALICDVRLEGIYREYGETVRKSYETCRLHGLIVKLPYKDRKETVELGLPL